MAAPVAETSVQYELQVRHPSEMSAHRVPLASALSLDALCEIIDRWVDVEHDAPFTARLVSRLWNEAVNDYASAWRNIRIKPPKNRKPGNHEEEKIRYMLKKAKGSALNVRVDLYTSIGFDPLNDLQKMWLQRNFARACQTDGSFGELSIYHLYRHQVAGSYVELPGLQELGDSIASAVGCGTLPRLKRLTVVSQPGFINRFAFENPISDGKWLFPHLPNVEYIVYLGLRAPCSLKLSCNALRSITIGRCVYETVADLIALMNCAPALESLTIVDLDFEKRQSNAHGIPLVHRSLKELNIGDFDCFCVAEGACARVLLGGISLMLPNLEQLRVCYQNVDSVYYRSLFQQPREPVPLVEFLARSSPPLRELQLITSLNLDDHQLREILRLTPLLANLQVLVPVETDTLRELLVSSESVDGDVLCPKLERLVLLGCGMQHMDVIQELAYNRRQLDASLGRGDVLLGDGKPMRALRFLHVYGFHDVVESAGSVAELIPAGTFLCSELPGTGHLTYSEMSMVNSDWTIRD